MKSEEEIRNEIRRCEDILQNVSDNEIAYKNEVRGELEGLKWALSFIEKIKTAIDETYTEFYLFEKDLTDEEKGYARALKLVLG